MKTVQFALRVLLELGRLSGEASVTQLSELLDADKATVSRHLRTLAEAGFVERNSTSGRYRLGSTHIELAGIVLGTMRLLDLARPLMSEIWQQHGESVQLAILRGSRGAFYVYRLETPPSIKYMPRIGSYGPLHCTATGKAMLAFLPSKSLEKIAAGPLDRFTPYTITDTKGLLNDLNRTRKRGYAIEDQGFRAELKSIAAPILSSSKIPVAAMGCGGPRGHFNATKTRAIGQALVLATQQISRDLHDDCVPTFTLP